MAVHSGTAAMRFCVIDTLENIEENALGFSQDLGGVELEAMAMVIFMIPADVA